MYKVKVYVRLKDSVLDPQGSAVQHSLHSMTYNE
ncbi:phosphoribosylformylglycinamidine synthase subunit PurS, partial [Bacillus vallismortis]|nr:phosphoribosylformylglycinamidine synthase subunit PurS [Bacillus vallismortis]